PVTGWVAPIDLTIIASNNMSYSTNVTYQKGGAVQITLGPDAAVTAGAQWRIAESAWYDSGTIVSGLAAGSYLLEYKSLTDWVEPDDEYVTVENEITNKLQRAYAYPIATLTVTISPDAANTAGAKWRIGTNTWISSGVSASIAEGTYDLNFNDVSGYVTPQTVSITLTNGRSTTYSAAYYSYRVIGEFGSQVGQMLSPAGVTADNQGNVYVADSGNARIQSISSSGFWNVYASPLLQYPVGVESDGAGGLYVVDGVSKRVLYLQLATGLWTDLQGSFDDPVDIIRSDAGVLFVSDRSAGVIWKWIPGLGWSKIVSTSDAQSGLRSPWGVGLDASGMLYVSDSYLTSTTSVYRIQKYSQAGVYQQTLLSETNERTSISFAAGFDVDADELYMAMPNGNKVLDVTMSSLQQQMVLGSNVLYSPTDVALGASNWLYVADTMNNRVVAIQLNTAGSSSATV
ncbi:MAG: hypothetical protein EOL87_18990, partial [Spartobacteria bacterium]|nr:hypothetical protein [Spartobacteria bacterium]